MALLASMPVPIRALRSASAATLLSMCSSDIVSKWMGKSEKLVAVQEDHTMELRPAAPGEGTATTPEAAPCCFIGRSAPGLASQSTPRRPEGARRGRRPHHGAS